MNNLRDDGERFMPDSMQGVIALEHLHRYYFALQFVSNREVLDIACGEGYGSAILARQGKRVLGVDIDSDAIQHAASRYGAPNIGFQQGTCTAIPLADESVDVVVSFETIEHHDQHSEMLDECKRVLREPGLLIISSPDKQEYSDRTGFTNPFHVKELYAEEFVTLLTSRFKHVRLLRQRVLGGSWLLQDGINPSLKFYHADSEIQQPSDEFPRAPYLLAVASDSELPPIAGGVLEEDVTRLSADAIREANRRTSTLVRVLATPGSALLRESLDSDWYLRTNQDLCGEGFDRCAHWWNNGADEGRLPAEDLKALAEGLLGEHTSAVIAACAGQGSQPSAALDLMTRQEAVFEQSRIEREQTFRSQLQMLQDRLEQEIRSAALLELAHKTQLDHTAEQQYSLRTMLSDELERTLSERDSQRHEAAAREAALLARLDHDATRYRSELNDQQRRFEIALDRQQVEARERDESAAQHAAELTALLSASITRERESQEQEIRWLQTADEQKSTLTERFEAEKCLLREQFAAKEASYLQEAAKLSDRLLNQEREFSMQMTRHQEQFKALSDLLAQKESDFSSRSNAFLASIASAQAANSQERESFARQEASVWSELGFARQNVADVTAAFRDQMQEASIRHQKLVEEHDATVKSLLEKIDQMEASFAWRWSAPLRALSRSKADTPRA